MSRFNDRYVKRENFAQVCREAGTYETLLEQYRKSGHLFCFTWPFDTRCDLCVRTDKELGY